MKDVIIRFLKTYAVFILIALLINLTMEMTIPTPEEKNAVGIVMFYLLFNFAGSIIFLLKNYRTRVMALLSFIVGFIMEFSFMRPDWVMKIYALQFTGDVVGAVIVSAIYWLIPWGVPAYILHRYVFKAAGKA
jgi:hypothetical protein